MQLAVGAGGQAHVDAGHPVRHGEHLDVLLARPAGARAGALLDVAQTERPHGLGHAALVLSGRGVDVGVQLLIFISSCGWVVSAVFYTLGLCPKGLLTGARISVASLSTDRLGHIRAVEIEVEA